MGALRKSVYSVHVTVCRADSTLFCSEGDMAGALFHRIITVSAFIIMITILLLLYIYNTLSYY